ncbi:hemagglutinin repeat-containing protein [Avibacterium sp. 20-126]|uniref:two-partner secretion domain-containing protein n=1 Tax=Avibacterium sp. 20-126 TaxID=2911524 RepID=UPI00218C85D9|nr:hemagglutinin repeat-containing protein [Avibacterium sp. 20-126]
MNKQFYRVIFSKTLNQLIVVSELARTQGKATSENVGAEKTSQNLTALCSPFSWVMKPVQFSMMVALGYVYFSTPAFANEMVIRADKSAPANQQATILKTANGLPQVNIQTPSQAGVSRNTYSQFDVAEKGAVLNNARKATQTQLAGWVQGNPNLATGEAKVILNEVNSNNPSHLKGYIEVAGKKADVVIANPSGIHCDGCGVINAGRSTLTTGKPDIANGELKGYQVKGGKVSVTGKGLDNRQADYTDIIAEKVQLDGRVWAKQLKVTTGKNKVNRTNDAVVYVGNKNNEKNDRTLNEGQEYRVDVGQLGGMYAERIQLVDNGTGLGVRNAGHIGASVGEVQIDSQGRIVNMGTLNANQTISLTTANDFENQGKIENLQGEIRFNSQSNIQQMGTVVARQGNIQATAKKAITQRGETLSKGNIRYNAERVNASKGAVIAAGVMISDQNGKEVRTLETPSEQGSSIHITSREKTTLQGQNLAAGKMQIDASEVDISHSQTAGYTLRINAKQQGIKADSATLTATGDLQWRTPALLSTQQADVKANWIDTRAIQINNQQGHWASLSDRAVNLALNKGLNNQSGLMLIGGDFILEQPSAALNNQYGRLFSAGSLQINAQQLDNRAGILSAENNAALTLTTSIQNQKIAETGSLIQAKNTLTLTAPSFNNTNTKPVDNATPQQGVIAKKIELNAQNLNNQQGDIYSVENTTLNVAQQLYNQQGEILSLGNLTINGTNAGIENAEGVISASTNLIIEANGLSGDGDIEADHTSLRLKQDFHAENDIIGRSSLILSTLGNLINQAGLYSEGNTAIQAANIDNQNHAEIQGKSTALTVSENLTNRGLIKGSEENIIKAGQTLSNIGTGRIYGGHTALQANKIIKSDELQADGSIKSAVIAATQRLDIAAPVIENTKNTFTQDWAFNGIGGTLTSEGQIIFGKNLDANHYAQGLSETLINRGGLIEGNGIQFGVKQLKNENARLRTNLEEVSNQAVNEHYLIVDDPQIGERINFDQLRWRSFSRAGRVVYKNQAIPSRPKDGGIAGYILPAPNEEACANEQTRTGCAPVPQAIYTNQDPVWAALNITPPETPAPELPDLSGLDPTLKEPVEPTKPRRHFFNRNRYEQELKEYEEKMVEYRKAMAEYEAKLIAYSAEMKPYLDWVNANAEKFEQLDTAIQKHNASLLGREFADFWDVYVTRRIERQTKVKETHPGKILSGGDIGFSGEVENNRSQIIAAGVIKTTNDTTNPINNIEEIGITQIDDIGNQEWTYSRWRGGFRRYHQREWTGRYDHMRRTETPLALNQASVESHTTFIPEAENANVTLNNVALTSHQQVGNAADHSLLQQNENEIRHIQANTSLPTSSLYRINPEGQKVLIETDPQFTNRKKWLSSDYMFNALRSEPQNILKRLGDGYYEQRMVRDQINQLTGRMFLDNQQDLENQYKALMDKGISFAKQFNLTPGIALSADQVAALTSDIVWFEPQTVTLPSGKKVDVIAPRVYVVAKKGDLNGEGALISANVVDLRTSHLNNLGTIAGRKIALLNTDTLRNEGNILGGKVGIKTTGNVENIGGKVEAEQGLFIDVGGDFTHQSTAHTTEVGLSHFKRNETTLARKALLYVKDKEGVLHLNANNILSQGADIINEGQGNTIVKAKNGLNLTALSVGFEEKMGKGNHYRNEKVQDAVVSTIKGKGNVLLSGRDITAEGAKLESEAKLMALAENNIVLSSVGTAREVEEYHKVQRRGVLSSRASENYSHRLANTHKVTHLTAGQIELSANHDIAFEGTQINADQSVIARAGNELNANAVTDTYAHTQWEKHKKSGITSSLEGGIAAVGYHKEKVRQQNTSYDETVKGASIKTQQGDVILNAGEHLTATAVEIQSGKDTHLQSKQVALNAADEQHYGESEYVRKMSGVGINMVYDPLTVGRNKYQSRKDSGMADTFVGDEISRAESITDTAEMVGRGVSPYLKHQQNEAYKNTYQKLAKSASINTEGKLQVIASAGDITTQGSQINAEKGAEFIASGSVNFDVATDIYSQNAEKRAKGFELNGLNKYIAGMGVSHEDGNQTRREERGTLITTGAETRVIAQGGDITGKGLTLINEGNTHLTAKGNVVLDTAKTLYNQSQKAMSHSVGEVATSDTERFFGYHRERHNQAGDNTTHTGSRILSLQGNVEIDAGKDYHQTSSAVLAKDKLRITAQNIYADAALNTDNQSQSQSDLKIGQFTRVKSPIIDLIQTVERTVKNKNASDRVNAANAVTLAAQGYQVADTIAKTVSQQDGLAYLIRVESGTGVAHSRQSQERQAQISQGNVFNAKQIDLTATGTGETLANGEQKRGNIHLEHSDLTSRDEQGKRLADSHITLTAYDTQLQAGKSHSKEKMRGQNVGVEVGMFAQAGPQTGVGVYATVGGGSQKRDAERTMYHNSHLDSAQITFNNQNDLTLKGATAKANRIDANVGGKLQIESMQDEQHLKSKSNQAGLSVSISFGNAWGGNIGFNADSGSEHYRQVTEQSGLFAEEGGYHVEANQVHLKGGAIASQNANNSELATNQLTVEHLQNHSSSQAMSGGLSYGFSHQEGHYEEKGTGKVVEAPANNQTADNLRWVDEKNSSGFNPSIPMYESHHDSSLTKATITEGKITLNKDSQPIHSTATALAKTLHFSTALDNANPHVEKPRDTQGQLKEQKVVREAVSQLQSATSTYAANQAKAAQLEADRLQQELAQAQSKPQATQDKQKIAEKTTALANTLERQEKWSEKGEYKRNLDNLTTIAGGILAGQSGTQIATTLASPTLNEKIKALTTDSNGEVNVLTNTLAHAVLGAVEAAAAKGNIATGAVAASASELAAPAITKLLGKDNPNQLSAEERQTVTALSALAGSLASGLTAQQNGSATNTVSTLNAAALGGEIGKRAVENNYLSVLSQKRRDDIREKIKNGNATKKEIVEYLQYEKDDQTSDYLVDKARYRPEEMTPQEWAEYENYAKRYVSESIQNRDIPKNIERSLKEILTGNYYKGYGYAYALDEKYRSSLPSRWFISDSDKSEEERIYERFNAKYIQNPRTLRESFNGRVAESTKEGLELASLGYISNIPKVVNTVELVTKVGGNKIVSTAIRLEKPTVGFIDKMLSEGIYHSYNPYANAVTRNIGNSIDSISKITPKQYVTGTMIGMSANMGAQYINTGTINYKEAIKSGLTTPYLIYTPMGTSFVLGSMSTVVDSRLSNSNSYFSDQYNYLKSTTGENLTNELLPYNIKSSTLGTTLSIFSGELINQYNKKEEVK